MTIRKGEGEKAKEITRHSRQMIQKFDICSNLSIYMQRMVYSGRRILFWQVPLLEGCIWLMEGGAGFYLWKSRPAGSFGRGFRELRQLRGGGLC